MDAEAYSYRLGTVVIALGPTGGVHDSVAGQMVNQEGYQPVRRCWLRFSLRTMLVLVTLVCVLCCYLSWAMNWTRQRREFLLIPGVDDLSELHAALKIREMGPAPLPLRVLGERGISSLSISSDDPYKDPDYKLMETARLLFPEARVSSGKIVIYRVRGGKVY